MFNVTVFLNVLGVLTKIYKPVKEQLKLIRGKQSKISALIRLYRGIVYLYVNVRYFESGSFIAGRNKARTVHGPVLPESLGRVNRVLVESDGHSGISLLNPYGLCII